MARWQLTLRDPLGTLAPLDLSVFEGDGGYTRDRYSQKVERHNRAGRPVITGPSYGYRYIWTLGLILSDLDCLRLERFERAQQARGGLIFDDEVTYVCPEPSPHSRSLISGSQISVSDAISGFGSFSVWIYLPENGGSTPWGKAEANMVSTSVVIHEIP
jgi:hypothetical protein